LRRSLTDFESASAELVSMLVFAALGHDIHVVVSPGGDEEPSIGRVIRQRIDVEATPDRSGLVQKDE